MHNNLLVFDASMSSQKHEIIFLTLYLLKLLTILTYILIRTIQNSLDPNLILSGMKTAFLTSVMGLGASIIFKFAESWKLKQKALQDETSEQVGEIADIFNDQLMSKFGENFKLLNDAVIGLNKWLDGYRENIELTQTLLQQTANDYQTILSSSEQQTKSIIEMTKSLDQYSKQSFDNMETLLGNIDDTMENTINKLNESTSNILTDVNTNVENINVNVSNLQYTNQEFAKTIKETMDEVQESLSVFSNLELDDASENISNLIQNITNATVKIEDFPDKTELALNKSIEQMGTATNESINKIGETNEASLQKLTDSLASISEKFADDYIPLTEKLQKVLSIANDVKLNDKE